MLLITTEDSIDDADADNVDDDNDYDDDDDDNDDNDDNDDDDTDAATDADKWRKRNRSKGSEINRRLMQIHILHDKNIAPNVSQLFLALESA